MVRRVDVDVRLTAMLMAVDMQPALSQVVEYLRPDQHEHDANQELQRRRHPGVPVQDGLLEQQDDHAQDKQRRRVAKPPRHPDPDAGPRIRVLGGDRRDGHDMVSVRCVLQPQQETERQRRPRAG